MNVGCSTCHLVFYKLSVYVLNTHWLKGTLLSSELAHRHIISATLANRIKVNQTLTYLTGWEVQEGGLKGTFINLIGQCCRELRVYEERPFEVHPVSYVLIG